MKPVLSKMHQDSAILAKNWVRIETPTQEHTPTRLVMITRPQKLRKELGNLRLAFKLQMIDTRKSYTCQATSDCTK